MVKKKAKESAVGTSLGDLLFQKNIKRDETPNEDSRVAELQRETAVLEEKLYALRSENEGLKKEINRLVAMVQEFHLGKKSFSSVLFARAVQGLKEGNALHVLGLLQAVLILDPGNIKAMINLGVAYSELGFREAAISSLREALANDPDNVVALRNLSVINQEASR